MLPKDRSEDLLKAIVNLKGNPDFEEVLFYFTETEVRCSEQACIQQDDILSKKYAGGFLLLKEFITLVKGIEAELEKHKKRIKVKGKIIY